MRKILITLSLFISISSFAQTDSTKIRLNELEAKFRAHESLRLSKDGCIENAAIHYRKGTDFIVASLLIPTLTNVIYREITNAKIKGYQSQLTTYETNRQKELAKARDQVEVNSINSKYDKLTLTSTDLIIKKEKSVSNMNIGCQIATLTGILTGLWHYQVGNSHLHDSYITVASNGFTYTF